MNDGMHVLLLHLLTKVSWGTVQKRLWACKQPWEILHLQFSTNCISFKVWVRYFVWNFKGYLWNSTQNSLPIHKKISFFLKCWKFKSPRFRSLYEFCNHFVPCVVNLDGGCKKRKEMKQVCIRMLNKNKLTTFMKHMMGSILNSVSSPCWNTPCHNATNEVNTCRELILWLRSEERVSSGGTLVTWL